MVKVKGFTINWDEHRLFSHSPLHLHVKITVDLLSDWKSSYYLSLAAYFFVTHVQDRRDSINDGKTPLILSIAISSQKSGNHHRDPSFRSFDSKTFGSGTINVLRLSNQELCLLSRAVLYCIFIWMITCSRCYFSPWITWPKYWSFVTMTV